MYLLLDIGGTSIKVGISRDKTSLDANEVINTNPNFLQAVEEIKQTAFKLSGSESFDLVAGGTRALDRTKTKLVNQPNFPLWVDEPLKDTLEKEFNCKVYLENDAAMAGLGEAVFGAGKGKDIIAYITVSTGLGGARIVKGKIDVSHFGFEPGNQIIVVDGKVNYLENLVGGAGIKKMFAQHPGDIKNPKVWEETAKYLAIGLNNTIVHWSPEVVILGGSVMKSISLEKVRACLNEFLKIFPEKPELKLAELEEKTGLYGALAYLKQLS